MLVRVTRRPSPRTMLAHLGLAAVLLLAACGGGRETDEGSPTRPERTVTGVVVTEVSELVFEMREDGDGTTLLVVHATAVPVRRGDLVEAVGVERTMDPAAIEAELRVELDERLLARYEGNMVLVANAVRVLVGRPST